MFSISGEFCPSDVGSSDDEETIAAAEREETEDSSRKEELEALQRESQMDLDEFLNELPQDYLQNRDNICVGFFFNVFCELFIYAFFSHLMFLLVV